jgi:hypothetical protein
MGANDRTSRSVRKEEQQSAGENDGRRHPEGGEKQPVSSNSRHRNLQHTAVIGRAYPGEPQLTCQRRGMSIRLIDGWIRTQRGSIGRRDRELFPTVAGKSLTLAHHCGMRPGHRDGNHRIGQGTPFANARCVARHPKGRLMTGPIAAYAVAITAMLFSGLSAFALFYFVGHLDVTDKS